MGPVDVMWFGEGSAYGSGVLRCSVSVDSLGRLRVVGRGWNDEWVLWFFGIFDWLFGAG